MAKIVSATVENNTYLFNWDYYYKSQQHKMDWRNQFEEFKKEGVFDVFLSVQFFHKKGESIAVDKLPPRLKNIKSGDRVFLSKKVFLPQKEIKRNSKVFTPRSIYNYGIIGSGKVFQEISPVPVMDASGDKAVVPLVYEENNFVIGVEWDTLLDFESDEILISNHLQHSLKHNMSGSLLKPETADELEKVWAEYIGKNIQTTSDTIAPDNELQEGTPYKVIQTRYERDQNARKACLKHYGYSCNVCEFNFEREYGEIGKDFIHVHHLNPISNSKETRSVNPINDLRPVCPNCHAMLHTENPPMGIDTLKEKIKNTKPLK